MRFKLVSEFFPETLQTLFPLVRAALSQYLDFLKSRADGALPKYPVSLSRVKVTIDDLLDLHPSGVNVCSPPGSWPASGGVGPVPPSGTEW
jgi:hypothetical protein